MLSNFQLREYFHLVTLRQLSVRLAGRSYAVKGGICLRFFHQSPRLSEDMDLDIAPNIRKDTLQKTVDGILSSQALLSSLTMHGVVRLDVSKPKQTDTTQRWKINLVMGDQVTLATKLEFSRRKDMLQFSKGFPDATLLKTYKYPPFVTQFYDLDKMITQKISALSAPSRIAIRDLFDLNFMFLSAGKKLEPKKIEVDSDVIRAAIEKTHHFTFTDFKEQVSPYLTEDAAQLVTNANDFKHLQEQVAIALSEITQ